jgi:hypothetical protein
MAEHQLAQRILVALRHAVDEFLVGRLTGCRTAHDRRFCRIDLVSTHWMPPIGMGSIHRAGPASPM